MAGILAVAEIKDGNFRKTSFEVASQAARLSKELHMPAAGLIAGNNIQNVAQTLGKYGISKVFVVDNPHFVDGYLEPYAKAVIAAAQKLDADHILFAASAKGKILASLVAAHFQTSAFTDCTAITIKNGKISLQRPIYAGKIILTVSPLKKPVIASLRPNVFPVVEEKTPQVDVENLPFTVEESLLKVKIVETTKSPVQKKELTEASTVVSGGRGIKGAEHFHLIEELADALGAAAGVSRAVVDAGWRPHEEQVGQTGKTVSPQLYVACGISGAIQHLAGMRTSKVIVAINKDPEAPIFQVADYGIVGDLFEVVPKMTELAKQMRKSS